MRFDEHAERPEWDKYFMMFAMLSASRSSCRHVRAGSVIVLDNRIIGTGYNGAPPNYPNCLDTGCTKEEAGEEYRSSLGSGLCDGVHAEINALANITPMEHAGFSLYTTIFPCKSCAKTLLANRVDKVVYKRKYEGKETDLAMRMFDKAGISVKQLDLRPEEIIDIMFRLKAPEVDFDVFRQGEKDSVKKLLEG